MKASLDWLNELLGVRLTAEDAASRLRRAGFDVTSATPVGGPVANVVAARVESAEKHPNADKLKVCTVFDGRDRWNVVCGAPNVEAGGVYPLARVGAVLPGGLTIEPRALRGVESRGMMCSSRELGLSEEHEGLFVLPSDAPLGRDVAELLGLNDVVLEVEVTPNRPDALSHWGLARELAASHDRPLRWSAPNLPRARAVRGAVKIESADWCPRYTARLLSGVRVGPSPLWMRLRLERCGQRAINNVVDVTNYVLLELGHPLHAFDRRRLAGGAIVVRRGRPGETLEGLDGVTRPVDGGPIIADAERPQALAGVLGGRASAVNESSTEVLLESAVFLPSEIRRARGRWNVSTESSHRFERGCDAEMSDAASRRAVRLLMDVAGARYEGAAEAGARGAALPSIRVSAKRLSVFLGFPVSGAEIKKALSPLGFGVKGSGDAWRLTPAVHRADVHETADVAEEIARRVGYDRVPERRRGAPVEPETPRPLHQLKETARARWIGWGFREACNSGLIARADWIRWAGPAAVTPVELDNPLSSAGECLNPSLLPNLFANARYNRRRGHSNVRLFEIARAFEPDASGGVRESDRLAWIAVGSSAEDHWAHRPRSLDVWDAKAWMKALVKDWRLAGVRFEDVDHPGFHPGESRTVKMGDRAIGVFGRLHPRRAEEWDLPPDAFAGEIDLTQASEGKRLPVRYAPFSGQPALLRDFSMTFPNAVAWSSLVLWIHARSAHVEDVSLFDVYTGGELPADRRSLAFRVSFRHPDRTLTDAEAAGLQESILKGLAEEFGGRIRAGASAS